MRNLIISFGIIISIFGSAEMVHGSETEANFSRKKTNLRPRAGSVLRSAKSILDYKLANPEQYPLAENALILQKNLVKKGEGTEIRPYDNLREDDVYRKRKLTLKSPQYFFAVPDELNFHGKNSFINIETGMMIRITEDDRNLQNSQIADVINNSSATFRRKYSLQAEVGKKRFFENRSMKFSRKNYKYSTAYERFFVSDFGRETQYFIFNAIHPITGRLFQIEIIFPVESFKLQELAEDLVLKIFNSFHLILFK